MRLETILLDNSDIYIPRRAVWLDSLSPSISPRVRPISPQVPAISQTPPLVIASRALFFEIEATYPVYEVSWDAPSNLDSYVITSGPKRHRHYKGFINRSQPLARLRSCPGEYPRIIDRRTGEGLILQDR
jgi:hypothetical protein